MKTLNTILNACGLFLIVTVILGLSGCLKTKSCKCDDCRCGATLKVSFESTNRTTQPKVIETPMLGPTIGSLSHSEFEVCAAYVVTTMIRANTQPWKNAVTVQDIYTEAWREMTNTAVRLRAEGKIR